MNAHPSSLSDRELIELAAKAAGITLAHNPFLHNRGAGALTAEGMWNPLEDDGDALRLAVKLKLKVTVGNGITMVEHQRIADVGVEFYEGAEVATRRAIVRAAAAIGQAK